MSSIRSQQRAAPAQGSAQADATRGGSGSNHFFGNLGFPGLLSVLAGLALCGSFFLPWLTASLICTDPLCNPAVVKTLHFPSGTAASPTGFSIASGTFAVNTGGPFGAIHEGFSFLLLWVVLLVGLLLIVLPPLQALGKVDASRTRFLLLVLCLLALAVEVDYGWSAAQALPQTRAGVAALLNGLAVSSGRAAVFTFSTGPAVGFWLALAATLIASGASAYIIYAAKTGRRFDMLRSWGTLGLSGQVALLAGLALCVAFFMPWFSMPDSTASPGTGWNEAANGLQFSVSASGLCTVCQAPQVSVFPYLWLIPLAALSLLLIAWLLSRGLLWRRMAGILICVALLVALALEGVYLLEVQSLQNFAEQVLQPTGTQLKGAVYSVAWGFWMALVVTGAALLVSSFLLLRRHKSVTGRLGTP